MNILEGLPLVGHGMAAGYAIAGDLDKAENVALGATKSTVVAGSVAASLACGPGAPVCAGAIGSVAAVGTNAAWDGVESVVRNETVGVIKTVEDIIERNKTFSSGDIFDISFEQSALAAGGAFGGVKINKGINSKFVNKVSETAKSTVKCICKREAPSDVDPDLLGLPPQLSQLSFKDKSVDGLIQTVVWLFMVLKLIFGKSPLRAPYMNEICSAVGKKDSSLLECESWIYKALELYDEPENQKLVDKSSYALDSLTSLVFDFDNLVSENLIGNGMELWICSNADEVIEDSNTLPDCVLKLKDAIRRTNLKFLPQLNIDEHLRFKRKAVCCASPTFRKNHFVSKDVNSVTREYFWGRNTRILTDKQKVYQQVFDKIAKGDFRYVDFKGKTQRVVTINGIDMIDELKRKGKDMVKERKVGSVDVFVSAHNQLVHLQSSI